MNDGAIDWYNEVPSLIAGTETMEHWIELSQKTGRTFSAVVRDVTGFHHIDEADRT